MNRQDVAALVGEVTRQASFGASGLATRAQLRRFEDNLATKIGNRVADRLTPPEPQLTPYQMAEYRRMCQRNEEFVKMARQAEADEIYCFLQSNPTSPALLERRRTLNERWLARLEEKNASSKKMCFLMREPSWFERIFLKRK